MASRAGLYVYVVVIFFESEFLRIILCDLWAIKKQKSLHKTSTHYG